MDDTSIEEVERSTSDYEMVEETGKVISEQTTAEGTNDDAGCTPTNDSRSFLILAWCV